MANTSNCSFLFDNEQLLILGLTQGITAIISSIGCLFVFFVMVIFKKYIYPAQRLLIYLTISVFLVSISFIIRGFGYSLIRNTQFCEATAFIGQYGGGCILASVTCIIIDIFVKSVLNKTWELEPLYVISIFGIPAVLDWLPFINNTYGPTRGWCWIRDTNYDMSCSPHIYGVVLQYVLWFIPSYTVTLMGGIAYIISLISLKRRNRTYTAILDPKRLQLQKAAITEIKHYQWYPLMYLIVNLIPLLMRLINDINPDVYIFPLWVISGAVQGLQGGFVTVLFSIDSDTRKRLKWSHLKSGFKYNVMNFDDTVEYPVQNDSKYTDSLQT